MYMKLTNVVAFGSQITAPLVTMKFVRIVMMLLDFLTSFCFAGPYKLLNDAQWKKNIILV